MQKKKTSIFWFIGVAVVIAAAAGAVIAFWPKITKWINEKLSKDDIDDMEFEDEEDGFLFEDEFDEEDVKAAEEAVLKEVEEVEAETAVEEAEEKAEEIFEEE